MIVFTATLNHDKRIRLQPFVASPVVVLLWRKIEPRLHEALHFVRFARTYCPVSFTDRVVRQIKFASKDLVYSIEEAWVYSYIVRRAVRGFDTLSARRTGKLCCRESESNGYRSFLVLPPSDRHIIVSRKEVKSSVLSAQGFVLNADRIQTS